MASPQRAVCIAGIGETEYTRWGGITDRSELALACEAILRAAADAGLDPSEIDGVASYSDDASEPGLLIEALGLPSLRFASMVWGGGGTGACGAIAHAVAAIRSGQAHTVAVVRSLCQGQGQRYGQLSGFPHNENFLLPFGMLSPPLMLAPVAMRYMHEHGITERQLGEVAVAFRAHAARNPRAVMGKRPLTMEDYLAGRMIAEPLRLYDCCQENDGACALIVTSLERARDLKSKPVGILAAAQGSDPRWGTGALGAHNMPSATYGSGNAGALADLLYGEAGLGPGDVDVAQIYDHFSPFVLMTLENFRICGRGEAGAFAEKGGLSWNGGRLPVNTSGGHLSEAYIHGLNLAVEGVRQMRGISTAQVDGAEVCLVTAGLGAALSSGVILGRI